MSDRTRDVNRFNEKLQNSLDRVDKALEDGEISQEDAEAIKRWAYASSHSPSTMRARIGHARIIAENSDIDLLDLDADDIDEVLFHLQNDRSWSRSNRRNYEKSLRDMYRSHNLDDLAERIDLTTAPRNKKWRREEIILLEDLRQMIDSDKTNIRDQALLSVGWECAYRASALLSLRIQDYTREGDTHGIIETPEAEGNKGAAGRIKPVTWSRGYLDSWLSQHPRKDDPTAVIFSKWKTDNEVDGEPFTTQRLRGIVKRAAEDADSLNADRVKPHSLRHGRATWMARNGYSEREIEQVMDWTENSDQHARYEHLVQEDRVNSLLRKAGIETEETSTEKESEQCPRCSSMNLAGAQYCAQCSLKLSMEQPPWVMLLEAVMPDDDPVLNEVRNDNDPPWNIAQLRPGIYPYVQDAVHVALMQGKVPEPPSQSQIERLNSHYELNLFSREDWNPADLAPQEAAELQEEIFGDSTGAEKYDEHYDEYPLEKKRRAEREWLFEEDMSISEYLDRLTLSDD